METGYYQPKIEDFHIGFRYEAYNGYEWNWADNDQGWLECEFHHVNCPHSLVQIEGAIKKGWIRAKEIVDVPQKALDFLKEQHIRWGENWDMIVDFFGQDVADDWDEIVGYKS